MDQHMWLISKAILSVQCTGMHVFLHYTQAVPSTLPSHLRRKDKGEFLYRSMQSWCRLHMHVHVPICATNADASVY